MRHIGLFPLLFSIAVSACAEKTASMVAPAAENTTIERGTYEVSFDLEYGYVFERSGERFFPSIAESERSKFDDFFSNSNLKNIVGKRGPYCECVVARSPDRAKAPVLKATLYVR